MASRRARVFVPHGDPPQLPPDENGDGDPEDDDPGDQLPPSPILADPGDLAALADVQYSSWTWHIYRIRTMQELAQQRTRQQNVWVLTITGPLNIADLRNAVGGGLFQAWGYLGGQLRTKHSFELEGPPKYWTPTVDASAAPGPGTSAIPSTPAASSYTPNGTDPVLLKLLEQQGNLLAQIAAKLSTPPPAAAPAGMGFREVLTLARELRGEGGNGGVAMKDLVALFEKGIEVGGSAQGGNDKSTLEMILEKGMPVLERIAVGMSRPRPPGVRPRPGAPPPPASGAAPREPSVATVLDTPAPDPPPRPAPVSDPAESARWNAAVGALARAIEEERDPDDFADTLDDLLLPGEIDLMLAGGAPAVMAQLRTASDRYPILDEPAAELFVAKVLEALVTPPGEDDPQ